MMNFSIDSLGFGKQKKKKILLVDDSPAYVLVSGKYYSAVPDIEEEVADPITYITENGLIAQHRESTIPIGQDYRDLMFDELKDDYDISTSCGIDDTLKKIREGSYDHIIMGTGIISDSISEFDLTKESAWEYFDFYHKNAGIVYNEAMKKKLDTIVLTPFEELKPFPDWLDTENHNSHVIYKKVQIGKTLNDIRREIDNK